MTDLMIVGQGLAAHVLMHTCHHYGVSFTAVGDGGLSNCSRIAAGIWNPVVFKRMTKSWLADDVISRLDAFYTGCEQQLHEKLITHRPLIKPFTEDQEKELWHRRSRAELANYLDGNIQTDADPLLAHYRIGNGYGTVNHCGNLNVARFLEASQVFFKERTVTEVFDHGRLRIHPDNVTYGNLQAKNIVFCEGHLVSENPYFNWIPLKPAKGETLTLEIPDLRLKNAIFNKNGFLMDIAPGFYKMGATYEWQDLSEAPTENGLMELTTKLSQMISCTYTVRKQEAGIRPSSIDRRPVIGQHPRYRRLFVFNGLGTKGVMLAPFFANNFVNFYLQKEKLNPEVNLSRFYGLYGTLKT